MIGAQSAIAQQRARRASLERNSAPPPGVVMEANPAAPLPLVPQPPSEAGGSGGPGPRERVLNKAGDDAAVSSPRSEVMSQWGKAKTKSKFTVGLTKAVGAAREMNRVMDYDDGPEEPHGSKSWGKSSNIYILLPDSQFRKIWDFFQVIFLFYVAVLTPLRIGFNIEVQGPGTDKGPSGT